MPVQALATLVKKARSRDICGPPALCASQLWDHLPAPSSHFPVSFSRFIAQVFGGQSFLCDALRILVVNRQYTERGAGLSMSNMDAGATSSGSLAFSVWICLKHEIFLWCYAQLLNQMQMR